MDINVHGYANILEYIRTDVAQTVRSERVLGTHTNETYLIGQCKHDKNFLLKHDFVIFIITCQS